MLRDAGDQPLRIGLVGAGNIAPFHLLAWANVARAEVVAIADPDMDRAACLARAHGIPRCYPDLDALLRGEQVDALDIASPRETHVQLVRAAAAHGVPVLCQKPLAPNAAEAAALVAEVAGRIRVMVHENWRFRPYYRQVAAWQAEGALGRLLSGAVRLRSASLLPDASGRLPAVEKQPFFRTERRLLVAETLIHHLDTVRWLFGPLQLTCARMQRTTEAVVGETVATLLLETSDGAPVLVEGNLTCPGYPPVTRDRIEFIGTAGSVTMEGDRLVLLGGPAPQSIQYEHEAAYQACFDAAVAHFAQALRSGAPFETDAAENLETLRLVDAAYEAAGWAA